MNPAATTYSAIQTALATVAPVLTGRNALAIDPNRVRPFILLAPVSDTPIDPVQRFRQQWTRTLAMEVFYDASPTFDLTADTLLNDIRRALVAIKGAVVRLDSVRFAPPDDPNLLLARLQIQVSFDYTLQFSE
jgi:hypothetical protein